MGKVSTQQFSKLLSMLFRAHPWHGIAPGRTAPKIVDCFIEMPAMSPVKIELDKVTGNLRVDRPQVYSSLNPTPYGFIPQTYCGPRVAGLCAKASGRKRIVGDGDPLDICVYSQSAYIDAGRQLKVRPIGGFRMIDRGQADDKILAVLVDDIEFGKVTDVSELEDELLDRDKHYLLNYKRSPRKRKTVVKIDALYGREEAHEVIRASMEDYRELFGDPDSRLLQLKDLLAAALAQESGRRRT